MPTAANELCFNQAHWRIIARGLDTERWFDDGQAVGNGGIVNPQATHLPTGQYYYRLTSRSAPEAARLGGGWWLDFEGFRAISASAAETGYRLCDAARLMLALPYQWRPDELTHLDLQVKALLRLPLKANTGYGKPAQGAADGADRGTRWIPTQHVRVRQLYVPGLYIRGRKEQLYETAFARPALTVALP